MFGKRWGTVLLIGMGVGACWQAPGKISRKADPLASVDTVWMPSSPGGFRWDLQASAHWRPWAHPDTDTLSSSFPEIPSPVLQSFLSSPQAFIFSTRAMSFHDTLFFPPIPSRLLSGCTALLSIPFAGYPWSDSSRPHPSMTLYARSPSGSFTRMDTFLISVDSTIRTLQPPITSTIYFAVPPARGETLSLAFVLTGERVQNNTPFLLGTPTLRTYGGTQPGFTLDSTRFSRGDAGPFLRGRAPLTVPIRYSLCHLDTLTLQLRIRGGSGGGEPIRLSQLPRYPFGIWYAQISPPSAPFQRGTFTLDLTLMTHGVPVLQYTFSYTLSPDTAGQILGQVGAFVTPFHLSFPRMDVSPSDSTLYLMDPGIAVPWDTLMRAFHIYRVRLHPDSISPLDSVAVYSPYTPGDSTPKWELGAFAVEDQPRRFWALIRVSTRQGGMIQTSGHMLVVLDTTGQVLHTWRFADSSGHPLSITRGPRGIWAWWEKPHGRDSLYLLQASGSTLVRSEGLALPDFFFSDVSPPEIGPIWIWEQAGSPGKVLFWNSMGTRVRLDFPSQRITKDTTFFVTPQHQPRWQAVTASDDRTLSPGKTLEFLAVPVSSTSPLPETLRVYRVYGGTWP